MLMEKSKFFATLLEYVRSNFREDLMIFVEATHYKKRVVVPINSITEDTFLQVFEFLDHSVSFSTCREDLYVSRLKDSIRERMKEGYFSGKENLPDLEDITNEQLFKFATESNSLLGTRKDEVNRRPFLFLDVDLADQLELLTTKNMIPPEVDTKEKLKEHLKNVMSGTEKQEMINALVNLNDFISETGCNAIIFSGNGLHIWFTLPTADINQYQYEKLYEGLVEKIAATNVLGGLLSDAGCGEINRNMRLPFTYNKKGRNPCKVEILYMSDNINKVSTYITDCLKVMENEDMDKRRPTVKGFDAPLHYLEELRKQAKKDYYPGMKDLQKDMRLWSFLKKYLTMKFVLQYLGMDAASRIKDRAGWNNINDPTRAPNDLDNQSSWGYKDETFCCYDFRNEESYDYGVFMCRMLDKLKESMGLYSLLPTTSSEAQLHLVMCAYLTMCVTRGRGAKFDFLEEVEDEELVKGTKKIIPGQDYYGNLMIKLDSIKDTVVHSVKDNSTYESTKKFIELMPRVYYFFEHTSNRKDSVATSIPTVTRLSIEKLFHTMKIMVNSYLGSEGLDVAEVFFVKNGQHVKYKENFEYLYTGEEKKVKVGELAHALIEMNAITAPKISEAYAEKVYSIYYGLRDLPNTVGMLFKQYGTKDPTMIKRAILSELAQKYECKDITEADINIGVCHRGDKYIQFQNCFVLYDSRDIDRIGEIVERSPESKYRLMKTSIVDIVMPFTYTPEGKMPIFEGFLDFLEYDGNNLKKIMTYFLASILARPDGTNTRALILLGSGKNGKSVIANILNGLFGKDEYVSTKDIHGICSNNDRGSNERVGLVNKLLNISMDSSGDELDPEFKKMVTGDSVNLRELYKASVDTVLRCHFMINANRLPYLQGESSAFMRRIFVGKLLRSVEIGQEDVDLASKIVSNEAGAIWAWIIQNHKIYKRSGTLGFLTPEEIRANEEMLMRDNAVHEFVSNYVHLDLEGGDNMKLTKTMFRRIYTEYSRTQDRKITSTDRILSEAEAFIKAKFIPMLTGKYRDMITRGFEYKGPDGLRGIPYVYIRVDKKSANIANDLDSRTS